MSSRKLEERIEQLRLLRTEPVIPATLSTLRKAFSDRSNLVIAEAARTTGELHLEELIPALLSAFEGLFEDPLKTDPKCWGKTAIVKALVQLDYSESPPFLRGSRHIQMEPVWGGREDSAALLRGNCFLALVQCTDLTRFAVLGHLIDAMSDSADPVRVEAVRAMHQLGGDDSVLLLRLKARLGDRRPLIIGHVFDALLSLERDRAVAFVAGYFGSAEVEMRDEAALALGSSRLDSALKLLIQAWKETENAEFSGILLRAISSSRLPEAIEFLIHILKTGTSRQVASATEALKLHEHSPEIQALVDQTKRTRGAR